MPWRLLPLHQPGEEALTLPPDGAVGVGRRPTNGVVCSDLAVSGQHCVLHCRRAAGGAPEAPEVEDCSTNGTWVNEVKLSKGQTRRLGDGDVLSLTKALEGDLQAAGQDVPPRVQFRLELCAGEGAGRPDGRADSPGADVPATAPEKRSGIGGGGSFAHDLLVQEQQGKAKITAELLVAQRRLAEEREGTEGSARELRKVRQLIEEERARRLEAEESRKRLSLEVETLRAERRQLHELQAAHEEATRKHAATEDALQSRLRHCVQLEEAQEKLRVEVAHATEARQGASRQQAELTARARQAQERSDRLEQGRAEGEHEALRREEEGARLGRELAGERAVREDLERQVKQSRERLARAEAGEKSAREALDVASARFAELECQASSAQTDAEAAGSAARQARQRLRDGSRLSARLRDVGRGVSAELRRRADAWEKALAEGRFEALAEAFAGHEAPTFAQVTCRQEDAEERAAGSGAAAAEESRGEAPSAPAPTAPAPTAPAALARGEEEDGLLEAVAKEPSAASASAAAAPAAGFSTAWSLEILPEPESKRPRLG